MNEDIIIMEMVGYCNLNIVPSKGGNVTSLFLTKTRRIQIKLYLTGKPRLIFKFCFIIGQFTKKSRGTLKQCVHEQLDIVTV